MQKKKKLPKAEIVQRLKNAGFIPPFDEMRDALRARQRAARAAAEKGGE